MIRPVFEGDKFGLLTVVREVDPGPAGRRVLCRCSCGNEEIRNLYALWRARPNAGKCRKCTDGGKWYPGQRKSHPLYKIWLWLWDRPLSVDKRWLHQPSEFVRYCEENGWKPGCRVAKKFRDKGYEPDNVWFPVRKKSKHVMSLSQRRRSGELISKNTSKPVKCLDTGEVYPSMSAASLAIGKTVNAISFSIRRKGKCAGMRWALVNPRQAV